MQSLLRSARSARGLTVALCVLTALLVSSASQAMIVIDRAELKSGVRLRVEGEGAVPDTTLLVNGAALGSSVGDGTFRIVNHATRHCLRVEDDGSMRLASVD